MGGREGNMGTDEHRALTINGIPVLLENPLDGWPKDLAAQIQRVSENEFVLTLRGTETLLVAQFILPVGEKLDVHDGG